MLEASAPVKPRLRGWIHQVAFFVSIPAAVALALVAGSGRARAVAIVYALSLAAAFGCSAAYHRVGWSPRGVRRMKRLDHSMIYVLIAGSYTPVSVLVLHGAWSIAILSVVWVGTAAGITLKLARPDGFHVTTGIMYMGLGWLALVALPQIVRGLSAAAVVLMVLGGVLYTVGAIVFATKRPDPRPSTFGYHEIWHAFMVAAAACHYAMILLLVRAAG